MKLHSIAVKNYRSIESEIFTIEPSDDTHTFALIGTNESGKSSFLKAVSLIDNGDVSHPRDFFDEEKPIEVTLRYQLEDSDKSNLRKEFESFGFEKKLIAAIDIVHIDVGVLFERSKNFAKSNFENVSFKKTSLREYTLVDGKPILKTLIADGDDLVLETLLKAKLPSDYFYKKSHFTTLWKSDPAHLISEAIDLDKFAESPTAVSVPLSNCFKLAGISDIKGEVVKIKADTSRRQNLEAKLGDTVTAHVKKVWSNHPVKVSFNINGSMLEFLIEDEDVPYRAKTTSQRSDGFKQFISFLLTISAQNHSKDLNRALLLLDEPETHLHPKAQELLREELVLITKNKQNNIVFYATHSSYMIDRDSVSRSYKVEKRNNEKTRITKIDGELNSYARTNYEVFDIISTDFHNELYGALQEKTGHYFIDDFETYLVGKGLAKEKTYVKVKSDSSKVSYDVSLPTYIRHLIHHPENGNNKKFTSAELEKSIRTLNKIHNELGLKKGTAFLRVGRKQS